MPRLYLVFLALVSILTGCERARPYSTQSRKEDSPTPGEKSEKKNEPLLPEVVWEDLGRDPFAKDLPIVFVHESLQPEEWKKLTAFWNDPGLVKPGDKEPHVVKIKVPLGLNDPTGYIPKHNPPTRGKWELGRRLFFDPAWLTDTTSTSCATCHNPKEGFSDGKRQSAGRRNTPTLVNIVFADRALFWDGRATYLEEAAQQRPEDERTGSIERHAFPGVMTRLRADKSYRKQFLRVFGVPPTQDTVGQALATYMRTILAADSLHDLAKHQQQLAKSATLQAAHYEPLIDAEVLKTLERPTGVKAVVAADLVRGSELFRGAAGCVNCHPAANGYFSDSRFHNIGIDATDEAWKEPDRTGRFAVAPLGEKGRLVMGAWKSPTLRGLLRTTPYYHNGDERNLRAVVRFHLMPREQDAPFNNYLDPLLSKPDGGHRNFGLDEGAISLLVLYLRALNGKEVDPFITAIPN